MTDNKSILETAWRKRLTMYAEAKEILDMSKQVYEEAVKIRPVNGQSSVWRILAFAELRRLHAVADKKKAVADSLWCKTLEKVFGEIHVVTFTENFCELDNGLIFRE